MHSFEKNSRNWLVLETIGLAGLSIFVFLWGLFYHIHTSELWSIHIADQYFNQNFKETIWIKPLFHLILKAFFILPVKDVAHLYLVKGFFALNSVIQIFLVFRIFQFVCRSLYFSEVIAFIGLLALALNPFYLNFAFRVRSDLLATTAFLVFIYGRVCKDLWSARFDLFFILLFPLIGLKHILLSIAVLAISLTGFKKFKFQLSRHYVFLLTAATGVVWALLYGWNSIVYYIATLDSYKDNLNYLTLWLKNDGVLIILGFLPGLAALMKASTNPLLSRIKFLNLGIFIYFLLVSQKFSFFVASLIPLFYVSAFVGILMILDRMREAHSARWVAGLIAGSYIALSAYNAKNYFPYHSNQNQMRFVSVVAPFLHKNNLSVVDGVGIFPRVPNWKCFYSPDDSRSTQYCLDLIKNAKPPVIILTGRLLNIISGDAELEKYRYDSTGGGVFLQMRINRSIFVELENLMRSSRIPDALTTFGLEL